MLADADTTEDAVLGGRLVLRQPRRGHRFGHDAILLAAAVDAQAGRIAVDLGAGVGAAGLALAHRVPRLDVRLVEIDATLAALARENAARNAPCRPGVGRRAGYRDRHSRSISREGGAAAGSADHVLMNPPFNDAARQNVSPDPARPQAHVARDDTLAASGWIARRGCSRRTAR